MRRNWRNAICCEPGDARIRPERRRSREEEGMASTFRSASRLPGQRSVSTAVPSTNTTNTPSATQLTGGRAR